MGLTLPAGLARANFLTDWFGSAAAAVELGSSGNVQTIGLQPLAALNLASVGGPPSVAGGGGETMIVGGGALLPAAGPLGTLADVAEWPSNGKISSYEVRAGDSLSEIAEMFNVSVNTIAWANNISVKTPLRAGQTLVVLPVSGVRHTVARGETLEQIAKKYHGEAAEILVYNGLEPKALAAGQVIIIPNGEVAPPPPANRRLSSPNQPGRQSLVRGGGPEYLGYYQRPIKGGVKTQDLHGYNGVDLAAPLGTPVLAAAAGRVIISRDSGWNGGYGQYVVIEHPNGTQTLYAHLSKNSVGAGESVSQGQTIGLMGSTGKSTGSHVHFEIRGAKNPF